MRGKFTNEQRHEMATRFAGGEKATALAKEFGCDESYFYSLASRGYGSWKPKRPVSPPNAYPDVMHKLMAGR